jgi:hypothetical protein
MSIKTTKIMNYKGVDDNPPECLSIPDKHGFVRAIYCGCSKCKCKICDGFKDRYKSRLICEKCQLRIDNLEKSKSNTCVLNYLRSKLTN